MTLAATATLPERADGAGRIARWLQMQRGRAALWVPVALGVGAAAYLLLKSEPAPVWGVMAAAGALAGLLLAAGLPGLRLPLVALACVALGFAAAVWRADQVGGPVIQTQTRMGEITGRVVDAYGHQDGRPRVLLAPETVPGLSPDQAPRLVRIALGKDDARPEPGTWIVVRARLTPLPTPVAPGAYDFARGAWFDGIGAYGFAIDPPRMLPPREQPGWLDGLSAWVGQLRHDASARIRAALPGSTGAIAAALTVGDRSEIDEKDDEAFRDSSLAHILSISGLHMAIVGIRAARKRSVANTPMPTIALRFNVKKWAAGAAIIVTAFYLLISGASVPAQRSFIMLALMFVAIMLDRQPFSLRVVALSAVAILLIAPESVLDPSFQMSFAAVTALVAAFEAYDAWQARRGRPMILRDTWTGRALHALAIAVLSSMVAGFATAPFAAYHFNRVAAYGVAANVLAMPLVTFVVMPFAAFTLIAMPFGLEYWPAQVMGWGIDAVLWIAHETASWPGAASAVATWPDAALALITLGGLWLALTRGVARLLGLVPMGLASVLIALASPPDVLIDRSGRNVAVRAEDGRLAVLSGRRARFAAEEWLERDGDSRPLRESARMARESVWTCADDICAATVKGRSVGVMDRAADAVIACARGFDLLVAGRAIAPCPHGVTITTADTDARGAYAITIGEGGFDIVTARDITGTRPWTVWPPETAPRKPSSQ